MNYPTIRIKSSFLLNGKVIPLLQAELRETGRTEEAEDEFINKKVKEYNQAWSEYEDKVIPAICQLLDLEFKQNIIDIYIAPFSNSISDPMVISTKYTTERFIDTIIHEIIHRLLTDNTKMPLKNNERLLSHWKPLFGEEYNFVTLVHIPVHAVLKYIFIDVLNEPSRFERDVETTKKYEAYKLAWSHVNDNDYKQIIEQVKAIY